MAGAGHRHVPRPQSLPIWLCPSWKAHSPLATRHSRKPGLLRGPAFKSSGVQGNRLQGNMADSELSWVALWGLSSGEANTPVSALLAANEVVAPRDPCSLSRRGPLVLWWPRLDTGADARSCLVGSWATRRFFRGKSSSFSFLLHFSECCCGSLRQVEPEKQLLLRKV